MFKETLECKETATCKGKCQKKTSNGLVSNMCARCQLSKERILSEITEKKK